mmetsp:Transcript_41143/g.42040  ORF Transcript_41143/g.42040 Transcript_41143/m.42040 type:complete len:203 (+) Transcript_41143:177-785(+)
MPNLDSKDTYEKPDQSILVFQCLKCNLIVGDSYAFSLAFEELQVIILNAASNIQKGRCVYTSKEGLDIGSTFYPFHCKGCESLLGRYYLTTSKALDRIREQFTFSVSSISSYEIGKPHHKTVSDVIDTPQTPEHRNSSRDRSKGSSNVEVAVAVDSSSEDFKKVKAVMVDALERLETLEEIEDRRKRKKLRRRRLNGRVTEL